MKKFILLTLFFVPPFCYGQGFSKEVFLNAVINDFVDSTWPVFYIDARAKVITFDSFKNAVDPRFLNGISKICNSVNFEPIDASTYWKQPKISRAEIISLGLKNSIRNCLNETIHFGKENVHSVREDGTVIGDGFLIFPQKSLHPYGNIFYEFSQPIFSTDSKYAIISRAKS